MIGLCFHPASWRRCSQLGGVIGRQGAGCPEHCTPPYPLHPLCPLRKLLIGSSPAATTAGPSPNSNSPKPQKCTGVCTTQCYYLFLFTIKTESLGYTSFVDMKSNKTRKITKPKHKLITYVYLLF